MTDTRALSSTTLRLLSVLLHYPDEELLGHLDELKTMAAALPEDESKRALRGFLEYLGAQPLLQLQERFTAAFDMSPATTLNLTYHAYGDNEKRAAALARLQRLYDQAGWERIAWELPDYLPLMLEFLAYHPRPETLVPIWLCLRATRPLTAALEATAPAYADLLRPLARAAAAVDLPDAATAPTPAA